ncbi:hypothetical protein [Streptomyces sp. NPDC048659]|uniref:hypothetical protein n=1 Tax=Streptomyces sp. NPDC048659 TaxID=3155489 RepID=UPI0034484571
MNSNLPDGWTIARVRKASGDPEAAPISLDRLVVVEQSDSGDYEVLQPHHILSFHDLCLVQADGEWFMGRMETEGSVICWASYGSGLGEAIRCL